MAEVVPISRLRLHVMGRVVASLVVCDSWTVHVKNLSTGMTH